MRFSKVRQLLVDFQLIPAPSLDFQVGLNLDETAPLTGQRHDRVQTESQKMQTLDSCFDLVTAVTRTPRKMSIVFERTGMVRHVFEKNRLVVEKLLNYQLFAF